jgi:hypothetical protein
VSVYRGAERIQDKAGRDLHVWQLTTLERSVCGERLGWALVAARDSEAARRRARALWPGVCVLDVYKGVPA